MIEYRRDGHELSVGAGLTPTPLHGQQRATLGSQSDIITPTIAVFGVKLRVSLIHY